MKRIAKILSLFTLLVAVLSTASAAWVYFAMRTPVELDSAVDIDVGRGETPQSVAERLQDQGVVRNALVMTLLARLRGTDREIRFGRHRFDGRLTIGDVLEELERAPQPVVRLMVAEGSTWADIAEELERSGIASAADYRAAACDPDVLAGLGALRSANCAEGFLFPDTYNLAPDTSAREIVALQIRRFGEVMSELLAELPSDTDNSLVAVGADDVDWRSDPTARASIVAKAVVLASIIEKEARLPEERTLISSVFHNRLDRGVRLQADPTVIYGVVNAGLPWDPAMLPRYLREPGPYNTYLVDGLPAGPICNPGRDALRAAFHPEKTNYLYFVARGDGSHEFSSSLDAHNRAVARLRKRRAEESRLTFARPSPSIAPEPAAEAGQDDTNEAPEGNF